MTARAVARRRPQAASIGIDLGGTKIEGVMLGTDGAELARRRIATPREDYAATLAAIGDLVAALERDARARSGSGSGPSLGRHAGPADGGGPKPVGIGMPGSISPATGRVQNANSTWLNGQPLHRDLAATLARPVQLANDANCFALSEATDGAGEGARIVLGVILGTGCGSGIAVDGRIVDGPRGNGGEWGHNPLPWPRPEEMPGPRCWCGRSGCMETWVSGPALVADHARTTGETATAEGIAARAAAGDALCLATLSRHADRLARGLAHVVNILDPDVIVLGGGLSKLAHLYRDLPRLIAPHIFADHASIDIRPPKWGDASGVRGAAWLWG